MIDVCRVCKQKNNFHVLIAKDYFLGTKKAYPYNFCKNCNSLSIQKIPSDLNELYKNYYSFSHPKNISWLRLQMYKYTLKYSNILSKFLRTFLTKQEDLPIISLSLAIVNRSSRILDVGCGSGATLDLLNRLGFKNCVGIDPFLQSDIIYPSGLKIRKQELYDLEEKFDIIMFNHVFEHFPDPQKALDHVCKLLNDSGLCIIRIPNIDSYSFMRYKENWFSIHAPFHFFLPSKSGMEAVANKAGLTINKIVGEQLVEFFFYSQGHELGVSDYERYGNRAFVEKHGVRQPPPLHTKSELKIFKERLRQVKKYDLCDWAVYYLRKK